MEGEREGEGWAALEMYFPHGLISKACPEKWQEIIIGKIFKKINSKLAENDDFFKSLTNKDFQI